MELTQDFLSSFKYISLHTHGIIMHDKKIGIDRQQFIPLKINTHPAFMLRLCVSRVCVCVLIWAHTQHLVVPKYIFTSKLFKKLTIKLTTNLLSTKYLLLPVSGFYHMWIVSVVVIFWSCCCVCVRSFFISVLILWCLLLKITPAWHSSSVLTCIEWAKYVLECSRRLSKRKRDGKTDK